MQNLIPIPTADTKEFWEGCKRKVLRFQKCLNCGYVRWPPSDLCSSCHSFDYKWIESSGRGKIYTFAVYRVAFHPAWKDKTPYITAVIELEEGPKILSNIVEASPESVSCDMPVEVVWERAGEYYIPRFKPL